MKTMFCVHSAAAFLIAAACGSARAELGFAEQFESGRGAGTAAGREEAVNHALQNVVSGKLGDMVSKGEIDNHPGFQEAVAEVAGNYKAYLNSYRVISIKECTVSRPGKDGKPEEAPGYEVMVEAVVNKARIRSDFDKALRMAELAKLGDNIAAILEEWAGTAKEGLQAGGRHASGAVERAFMNYKFRQVSSLPAQQRFAADLKSGKRLEEAEFKNALLASLKGLGADIIVVGSVETRFLRKAPAKKESAARGCVFEIKGWVEAYARKKLDLLGRIEETAELESEFESEEEARQDLLSRAGGAFAAALIAEITKEKEEAADPIEASRPVVLAFEGVPESMKASIASKLEKMADVANVKILRFGKDAMVFRVMARTEPDAFAKALLKAFKDEGLKIESSSEGKIVMRK